MRFVQLPCSCLVQLPCVMRVIVALMSACKQLCSVGACGNFLRA